MQHELHVHLLDETPTALESMQHEFYYADLDLVAAENPNALESMQHALDYADLDLVAAKNPTALESMQLEPDVHLLDVTPSALESIQHKFYFADLDLVAAENPTALELSPLCRMSACRFCCPNGDILCRVGKMSRHVAGHVADTRKCRVGRVSKTTRHLTTCRGIPDMSVIS